MRRRPWAPCDDRRVGQPETDRDSGAPRRPPVPASGREDAATSSYDRYQRAVELLDAGDSQGAAVILAGLLESDGRTASVLEAYARALFDSRRYHDAAEAFAELVERSPAEDYAHYGLGLSLWRLQRFLPARDHLAMAFVMRPDRAEYGQALGQVKATLRARALDNLPLEGPLGT